MTKLGLAHLFLGFQKIGTLFELVRTTLARKNWALGQNRKPKTGQKIAIFESIGTLFKNAETVAITGFEALWTTF